MQRFKCDQYPSRLLNSQTVSFTFFIDRDGAKRLAILLLSQALSRSIDEQDALRELAEVYKRLEDLLPDIASWTQRFLIMNSYYSEVYPLIQPFLEYARWIIAILIATWLTCGITAAGINKHKAEDC